MKCLSAKQVNQFKQNGFLLVRNVFSESMCSEYKKILVKEIDKGKKIYQKYDNKKKLQITRMSLQGYPAELTRESCKILHIVIQNLCNLQKTRD